MICDNFSVSFRYFPPVYVLFFLFLFSFCFLFPFNDNITMTYESSFNLCNTTAAFGKLTHRVFLKDHEQYYKVDYICSQITTFKSAKTLPIFVIQLLTYKFAVMPLGIII